MAQIYPQQPSYLQRSSRAQILPKNDTSTDKRVMSTILKGNKTEELFSPTLPANAQQCSVIAMLSNSNAQQCSETVMLSNSNH